MASGLHPHLLFMSDGWSRCSVESKYLFKKIIKSWFYVFLSIFFFNSLLLQYQPVVFVSSVHTDTQTLLVYMCLICPQNKWSNSKTGCSIAAFDYCCFKASKREAWFNSCFSHFITLSSTKLSTGLTPRFDKIIIVIGRMQFRAEFVLNSYGIIIAFHLVSRSWLTITGTFLLTSFLHQRSSAKRKWEAGWWKENPCWFL